MGKPDTLLWFGTEGLYAGDSRDGAESCIPLLGGDAWIPYVPKFYDVWENGAHYQEELRGLLGRTPLRKRRVLVAAPDDLTAIETIAIEDFIYAALGGSVKYKGLLLRSHSQMLGSREDRYIAVTRSCRCYCAALVQNGEVAEKALMDVNDCTRDALIRAVRDFHSRCHDNSIEVRYPQMEEDWLLMGLGAAVEFGQMMDRYLP